MKTQFVAALGSIMLTAACAGGGGSAAGGGAGAPTSQSIKSFEQLSAHILQPKCVRCHSAGNPRGGVDLSSYDAIIANAGLVVKGVPTSSRMYNEVASGDMPQGGPPLTSAEVQSIAGWINAAAPNGDF